MRARNNVLISSPAAIGALSALACAVFVVMRTLVAGHGHIGSLVVAGSGYVTPGLGARGVPVRAGSGYDGQFYYRLALGPLNWSRVAFGIHLDTLARLDRVAYPALVWLASAGMHAAVPAMLPVVNVACMGALAGVAAALAREAGRHPVCGLMIAGFWGFLWSVSRDLTEPTEALFVLAALLALQKSKPVAAGLCLAVAVLAREPALILVVSIFIARALTLGGRRWAPGHVARAMSFAGGVMATRRWTVDVAWGLPALVFAGWQAALKVGTGTFAAGTAGHDNTGPPLVGLARGALHYVERLPSTASLLWTAELAILFVVAASAAISLRKSSAALHEKLAWLMSVVLTACLTKGIWLGDVGFRSLDDLFVLSCVLLLFSKSRLGAAGWAVAGAWCVVAVELVLFI